MDGLKEALLEYKNITQRLINCLECQNYDSLNELLHDRQELIDVIKTMEYSGDEFKTICQSTGLPSLQKKLDQLYYERLRSAREGFKNTISGKRVYQSYGRTSQVDSIYFNKKI